MKNMKVRTKLNLILVLVILLVALGSVVSIKDLGDVKDKASETMDASSRQSYDDSIKEQVGVVISLSFPLQVEVPLYQPQASAECGLDNSGVQLPHHVYRLGAGDVCPGLYRGVLQTLWML